jgi:hypothetical protein
MAVDALGAGRVLVWRYVASSRRVSPVAGAVAGEASYSLSSLAWRWSDKSVEDIHPFEQSLQLRRAVIAMAASELQREAPAFARELIGSSVWCEPVVVGQPVGILMVEPAPSGAAAAGCAANRHERRGAPDVAGRRARPDPGRAAAGADRGGRGSHRLARGAARDGLRKAREPDQHDPRERVPGDRRPARSADVELRRRASRPATPGRCSATRSSRRRSWRPRSPRSARSPRSTATIHASPAGGPRTSACRRRRRAARSPAESDRCAARSIQRSRARFATTTCA